MSAKHTPTPWRLGKSGAIVCETPIPEMRSDIPENQEFYGGHLVAESVTKANAEFIVLVCNSHEELLEAAKEMFTVLMRKPNGKLWPNEEELSRWTISWNQRIAKAEARP
jgi:hypothetical protein